MTAILPQSLFADIGDGLHIHYHAIGQVFNKYGHGAQVERTDEKTPAT
jgi:hypothetical protein